MYRWAGVALLRVSTDPGGLDLPDDLDLFGDNAVDSGLAWLSALWRRDDILTAVGVASPALARQVDDLLAHGGGDVRAVRRTVLAVASYLLRWQHRPTPFGMFAGVGVARIGAKAKVRWGGQHRIVIRADAAWLSDVLAQLHKCRDLRERLSVVANDTGMVRGGRFVVPGSAPAADPDELAAVEVSVRHTRPVRAALDAAREPVAVGQLRTRLLGAFPSATPAQIDRLLADLIEQGMLISCLSAPMTCLDALAHLRAQLDTAAAQTILEISGMVRELSAIHRELSADNTVAIEPVTERMRALSRAAEVPLVVDTGVDCDVQIPDQVAREARDAVGVLFRLSPYPWGYPAWRDYHDRFRARYGAGALVPVLELVADSGLGLPAEYLGSAYGRTARQVSERDEKLLTLIQQATMDGSGEIVLTDQVIDDLTAGDRTESVHLPARIEVAVEIHSPSLEALARGRFALTVTGTPRPGSSMVGRHAHLLSDMDRQVLADTFVAAEPGAVAAQLSFAPRKRHNENVARTEHLVPHVIALAEHRETAEYVIPVADLAVTADEHRFYLIQRSTGRRIEPRVTHALEAGVQTPPLARFLAEITTARSAVYKAFHFGAAARLPYLPGIRYRRTTLSSARWLLSTMDLPGRRARMADWEAGFDAWRARWRVPQHVALVDHDRRQPVDLGHRLHRAVVRTRLDRAGHLELREAAAPQERGWLGRAHEVLIPLVLDVSASHTPVPVTGPPRVVGSDAGHLPGHATIVCAQLYGHPARVDEILTERLPDLINTLGTAPLCWWFRRHRQMRHPETDQYLSLYLRVAEPSAYGWAAERLADWAGRLRRERLLSHLALATYEPQAGRYGHGLAMDRAQDVFAADSAAAIAQLTVAVRAGVPSQALAAASLVDLAVTFTGSVRAGMAWLVGELSHDTGRPDPALRRQALELADPDGTWTTLRSLPGGSDVVTAWRTRAAVLDLYRDALAEQRDPLTVLRSLLHVHHNRAAGVDPAIERITTRLARACALRHTVRVEA